MCVIKITHTAVRPLSVGFVVTVSATIAVRFTLNLQIIAPANAPLVPSVNPPQRDIDLQPAFLLLVQERFLLRQVIMMTEQMFLLLKAQLQDIRFLGGLERVEELERVLSEWTTISL